MADRNPNRPSNWKMVCFFCRAEFLGREKVQALADHFKMIHDGRPVKMELVWIGRGPAPARTPRSED